jgi:hypothetical protein
VHAQDPDLQAQVVGFIRVQDQQIRSAKWCDVNTVVVEAILAFVHESKRDCIYVAEIAKAAEAILAKRDDDLKLQPRAIGARLAALGLITEPRDAKGIRLTLSAGISRQVHELAASLSVPLPSGGVVKRCAQCGKMKLHAKGVVI